ncbi:MAG: hypothetical protein ACJ73S_21835 [Mycobacteriales bacterium]
MATLAGIQQWIAGNYLVVNGQSLYDAAWPAGSASVAANGEAGTLRSLLTGGGQRATDAATALGTYKSDFASAHDQIKGLQKQWDQADETYRTGLRDLEKHSPVGSRDYEDSKKALGDDRDGTQGRLRHQHDTIMTSLRGAAQTAAQAVGGLLPAGAGHGRNLEGSIDGLVLGQLPLTKQALSAQAGQDLANDIRAQYDKKPPDWAKIRQDMAGLEGHENDPAFNDAFVATLGPDRLLGLPDSFQHNGTPPLSKDQLHQNGILLGLVANATAGYVSRHPEFGTALIAAGRHPDPNAADSSDRSYRADKNLGLILAAGKKWPTTFLVNASDDIYQRDRQLWNYNHSDPWNVTSDPNPLTDQDPGWGDPMTNALHALGRQDDAARQFFAGPDGNADPDKLHHLIKERKYGAYNAGEDAKRVRVTDGDGGKSLGEALEAATRRDHGSAAADHLSGSIAVDMVHTIAQDPGTANMQPPMMRPYTGHILANYAHDLNDSLYGSDPRDMGNDSSGWHAGVGPDGTVRFDGGELRAAMRDTFVDKGAYNDVLHAATQDANQTMIDHANHATNYDDAVRQARHDADRAGQSIGEIANAREQARLDGAEHMDQVETDRMNTASDFLGLAPGGKVVGAGINEGWNNLAGDHIFDTGHLDRVHASQTHDLNAVDHGAESSTVQQQVNDRLNALAGNGRADSGDVNDIWRAYHDSYGTAANRNLSADADQRWKDGHYS